jgi:hypothetical protein
MMITLASRAIDSSSLFLGGRPEGKARDLGEPVHDAGHFGAELAGNVLGPHVRVLHHVVQQRRGDGGAVEELLGEDEGHGDAMGYEVLARHPLLPPVRGRAVAKRAVDQLEVEPVGVTLQHRPELGGGVVQELGGCRHPATRAAFAIVDRMHPCGGGGQPQRGGGSTRSGPARQGD